MVRLFLTFSRNLCPHIIGTVLLTGFMQIMGLFGVITRITRRLLSEKNKDMLFLSFCAR